MEITKRTYSIGQTKALLKPLAVKHREIMLIVTGIERQNWTHQHVTCLHKSTQGDLPNNRISVWNKWQIGQMAFSVSMLNRVGLHCSKKKHHVSDIITILYASVPIGGWKFPGPWLLHFAVRWLFQFIPDVWYLSHWKLFETPGWLGLRLQLCSLFSASQHSWFSPWLLQLFLHRMKTLK